MHFDLAEIFEDAAERAGFEIRTGYDWKSSRRALAFLLREWANDGYNLYSISTRTVSTVVGQTDYTLDTDVIDVTDVVVRQYAATANQIDVALGRISYAQYVNTPNKLTRGRPSQFTVRRLATPVLVIYPAPDQVYTLPYWVLTTLAEPGTGGGHVEVPDRFIPALISGLAYHMALKRPGLAARLPMLQAEYTRQWNLAREEDRERANLVISPLSRTR